MSRIIGHIDADCFYVSAERVRFASLRGIPVGVLGNQGACVIAKSYELKAMGVKTGVPIWEARKLCPEAVYVKRDFHWYEALSRKMLDVLNPRFYGTPAMISNNEFLKPPSAPAWNERVSFCGEGWSGDLTGSRRITERAEKKPKDGKDRRENRRLNAGWNEDYLAKVVFGA